MAIYHTLYYTDVSIGVGGRITIPQGLRARWTRLGAIYRRWRSKGRKIACRCWRRRSAGPALRGLHRSKRRRGHHLGGITMVLRFSPD